ncbi:MAG: DUF1801 domain-containing protein [Chloroflexi bacterium]|nr:DUF1801 domain-containing protein [Chloroflexota bacterium]
MAARTIEDYAAGLGDWRAQAVLAAAATIRGAAPDATASIKWAQPVFESNGPFAYIKAFARTVNVGFWRGVELDDPDGVLVGDGDRMRHIALRSLADLDGDHIARLVRRAVALNAEKGSPTLRQR